ncbi:hypothetical protein ES703_116346 [subsurface metagenome]
MASLPYLSLISVSLSATRSSASGHPTSLNSPEPLGPVLMSGLFSLSGAWSTRCIWSPFTHPDM